MRSLAQPEVFRSAAIAALISSLLCFPRLWLWETRKYPLWYLEALLFLGGTVLWAFVFAWYTKYARRPVFTLKWELRPFALATLVGTGSALLMYLFLDPSLRARMPEEYPASLRHWLAIVLFSLAFSQLFLVFAPLAWLMRLFQGRPIALPLVVVFGAAVMVIKDHSSPHPLPPLLFLVMLAIRLAGGLLSVYFFLRGGVLLVWWWALLVQSRHVIKLIHDY